MGFNPVLFDFLSELKKNNNREWFQANKSRYEKDVKTPALDFIAAFAARVPEISPHIMAIPKPSGGSMFRIYRDMRFSKDKTPYKTGVGIQFRHKRGKDAHAPGYYLHLEPGEVFAGCGIWKPDTGTLTRIRTKIAEHPDQWLEVIEEKEFAKTFTLWGESLKRPPKGFDPDHVLIEDLKRKHHIASFELSESQVFLPDFLDTYLDLCKTAAPYMRFLSQALGLDW
ncbi:MAG: DUF2461 domain-containing protein [Chloroflexi bacterium]|nr:DUF2461 domain-containing protein [Chloroflexota bacterium]